MLGLGFITSLLGSKKGMDTVSSTLGHVASGLDKLHFSEEEKSDAHMKGFDFYIEYMKTQSDQSSVRSRTRRWLAVGIIGNFLVLLNTSAVLYIVYDSKEKASHILELANTLSWAVSAVVIFYFGYYGIKKIVESAKK